MATIAQFEQVARARRGWDPATGRPSIARRKTAGLPPVSLRPCRSMAPLHHVEPRGTRRDRWMTFFQAGGRVGVAVRQLPDQIRAVFWNRPQTGDRRLDVSNTYVTVSCPPAITASIRPRSTRLTGCLTRRRAVSPRTGARARRRRGVEKPRRRPHESSPILTLAAQT